MNFLAHIYLSDEDKEIAIGNFIADSLPSNNFQYFPEKIRMGIVLHRAIDTFTDAHPIFRKSKKRLFKNYRHYSPVIVDIIYDHFLAKNWKNYHAKELDLFVDEFYHSLDEYFDILPIQTQRMMPFMIKDNWLLSYAHKEGIAKILHQMNHRTKNRSKMNLAIIDLDENYQDFEEEFTTFFEELRNFAKVKLREIKRDFSNKKAKNN
ncbi:MAG: acyl carrier protein phosphodiesterase [Flavobacteriales bacterium]|jgi:acyl carrier protein phosphodiesterase|nr:acyl carrier protein phosphodiesterase [Flavobacteriales bacterium]